MLVPVADVMRLVIPQGEKVETFTGAFHDGYGSASQVLTRGRRMGNIAVEVFYTYSML